MIKIAGRGKDNGIRKGVHVAKKYDYLLGRLAKITERGVELEKEYSKLFGIGNTNTAYQNFHFCHQGGRYELYLMFIDEEPFEHMGMTWYCLKEVGVGVSGDWYWYTLSQLIFCDE